MKHSRWQGSFCLLFALVFAALAGNAFAQAKGQKEWEALVAAAEKEGPHRATDSCHSSRSRAGIILDSHQPGACSRVRFAVRRRRRHG